MPTILDRWASPIPLQCDGRSLSVFLTGDQERSAGESAFFAIAFRDGERAGGPGSGAAARRQCPSPMGEPISALRRSWPCSSIRKAIRCGPATLFIMRPIAARPCPGRGAGGAYRCGRGAAFRMRPRAGPSARALGPAARRVCHRRAVIVAEIAHHAAITSRFAGLAHIAAVQDEPVVGALAVAFWYDFQQAFFDF